MKRIYNFSAGPSMLPPSVVARIQADLPSWRSTGMSVMEMSHRGAAFGEIAEKTRADFRALINAPDHYHILFLAGGARAQFAAIPLNLTATKNKVTYFNTGAWSKAAIAEAERYVSVEIVASSEASSFTTLPPPDQWRIDPDAAYVHYTANETIDGVEFQDTPDVGAIPLVSDMSSNILSRSIELARFGLIYAGAQKNLGIAGLGVVIVRDDLLGRARAETPSVMNYTLQSQQGSMVNTPPVFAWYVLGLVLEWVKEQGGVVEIEKRNIAKARKLYDAIDASALYSNPVEKSVRSRMNVPFRLPEALQKRFLTEAQAAGLVNLEGHRSVGGLRASIYNAMPEEGVDALIAFMQDFEKRRG